MAVAPNADLRREAVIIFDRTFAVTWALEGVAIIVAMLGAANSLLALVLDRRRELGLLRYLGAAAGQIRRMILVEAGLLGFFALLLGAALGWSFAAVDLRDQQTEFRLDDSVPSPALAAGRSVAAGLGRHAFWPAFIPRGLPRG